MTTRTALALGLGLMGLLAGCRNQDLIATTSALRFAPDGLDFGNVYIDGVPREASVIIVNDGRSVTSVTWHGLEAPFEAELPSELQPGETSITVRVTPNLAGKISKRLSLSGHTAVLTLTANGVPLPSCTPSDSCVSSQFDEQQGACVEKPKDDGVRCDAQSVCITNGQCLSGRCVGHETVCDDGNACTVDVCNAARGCEFLPRPPCPGDGACMVGVCNPVSGCGMTPVDDGSTCGSIQTCTSAPVCVAGACVVRDPPEGYLCAEASPCQSEGRCVKDQCVRSTPPVNLTDTWSYDSFPTANPDAGLEAKQLHDFLIEPSGAMTLSGFFQSASILRANTPAAVEAPEGPSRRCILWNSRLVCADYPTAPNGRVTALDLASGATVWSFDIRAARPDFVAQTSQIFLARLVVQASDRLAAIFEAYPVRVASGSVNSQCRTYFLVVMNASGQLVTSLPLQDPLLDVCNHPHPYGAVSDAVGNLFLAFSPTLSAQAPLKPGSPTLLISYTRDGFFRWKVTDANMRGGELAVARGLLYPENGEVVRTAATGGNAFAVPQTLGRIVVADSRFIPAPIAGQVSLMGYEAGQPSLSWTHQLPAGQRFWSDQLRLATWATSGGPEAIALAFVHDANSSVSALRGIRVRDGSEAFTCPIAVTMRTPPQLFEIANGSMGLMEGALDLENAPGCSKCDPPFAGSSAAFHWFQLQGISMPHAPWVGTFGGAGHDHREELDPSTPGNASN